MVIAVSTHALGETVVIALLERVGPGNWARYRGLFMTLRARFPIVVVNKKAKGRVNRKIVAYLKRHEAVWENMYMLLGWRIVERYEVGMEKLKRWCDELRKLLEALKELEGLPQWLREFVKPTISLGGLSLDEVASFMETVEKRFAEYMATPEILSGIRPVTTRFHKLLRSSKISALVIRFGDRNEMYKRIRQRLYELLERGVAPIDYSYNAIVIAKKIVRYRGIERVWNSSMNLDPEDVIKGFETRYEIVVRGVGLEFEKRDVGWGLKPAT